MTSTTKLKKKFRELAARLPKVSINNVPVDHYKQIRAAYKNGGQKAVFAYCAPFMLQGAKDHYEKENASEWKRSPGLDSVK